MAVFREYGRRMADLTNATTGDLDQIAQSKGYPDAAAAAMDQGRTLDELASAWGVTNYNPEGGTSRRQVADSDYTVPLWQDLAVMAAAGLGGGLLGSALAPAAASTAAAAPEAAAAVGLPGTITTAAGTTLPASTLPAAGGGAGWFSSIGANSAPLTGVASGSGTMGTIAKLLGSGLKMAGGAIGAADNAAANNRSVEDEFNLRKSQQEQDFALRKAQLDQQNANLGLQGFEANTSADNALQAELIARARLEDDQRGTDLRNLYKQSVALNPSTSPYDPKAPAALSPAYLKALADLAEQGGAELAQAPTYSAAKMPKPTPRTYTPPPYTPPTWTPSTFVPQGSMSKVGNWLAPLLVGAGGLLG